jgi:4-hydroxy-2-oxoheptanedioate aldolase
MPMFRELLRSSDGPVVGTFVKIPALEVAEIVGEAGFDFVVIDTEHALLSVRDVYQMSVL